MNGHPAIGLFDTLLALDLSYHPQTWPNCAVLTWNGGRGVTVIIEPEEGIPISQSPPKETILVVDDELEVLALIVDVLQAKGYTVLSASDPREALRLARTRSEPIHLLLTDVVMPFMNGRELAEEVRTICPGIKLLFMSAYTTDVIEDYGIRITPGEPFVVKPFTVVALANKVQAVLDYQSPFSKPNRR